MRRMAIASVLVCALFAVPALARDDGRYSNSNPETKAWVKGLKSKASGANGCCDISDGSPPEAAWDMGGGKYRVVIDGVTYDVPNEAMITEPNKLGYAVVWFFYENGLPKIRCFMPGAGG